MPAFLMLTPDPAWHARMLTGILVQHECNRSLALRLINGSLTLLLCSGSTPHD